MGQLGMIAALCGVFSPVKIRCLISPENQFGGGSLGRLSKIPTGVDNLSQPVLQVAQCNVDAGRRSDDGKKANDE
jgi:hypothetical protein